MGDSGVLAFGPLDPCVQVWPNIMPLLMACGGMLSHAPVGRTGDPVFEHQVVVGGGTAVMCIGNFAWFIFARSAPMECAEAIGEPHARSPTLVENYPIKLWQIFLVVQFSVVFKMHMVLAPVSIPGGS